MLAKDRSELIAVTSYGGIKMSEINRRNFLRFIGQGTTVLSLGLSSSGWDRVGIAWAADAQVRQAADTWDWDAWELYYPGKYDAADAKVLNDFQAELDKINKRGNIDIKEMIKSKLAEASEGRRGGPGGGEPGGGKVAYDSMIKLANQCGLGNSPLYTDREYAKKTKYGDLISIPLHSSLEIMPAMPKSKGIGDYMVVSDLCHTMNYYKPYYEGDTLFVVTDGQYFEDTTPAAGSHYRTFVMKGWGRVFNQKGEMVAEGASMTNESFRRHKDPAKRNRSGAHAWESPDWWTRKAHMYTDQDYDTMRGIWKNEKSRGATPLYWDEVKIGDEPTPTLTGPVIADGDMLSELSQSVLDTKKNVMDPKIFAKMVKNKQGIYALPEDLEKKAGPAGRMGGVPGGDPMASGGMPPGQGGAPGAQESSGIERVQRGVTDFETETTERIQNTDGRPVFWNVMVHRWVAGMLTNWMGDQGWLQRIGRDMMALPPGASKAVNYKSPSTFIPNIPQKLYPALFDRFPYLEKVPYMKGKRATWHGLAGDAAISKAYVFDKYSKNGEYFVDLIWWVEALDKYLILEGFATVKLPKKS
jgi:acyl dehydratase